MKYIDEYRSSDTVGQYLSLIDRISTRPWTIMEVCGGQTHAIVKYQLQKLLPDHIRLVHGPGCPVCVTSLELIDRAISIASLPQVIFCSFGDMLRVPGSQTDLLRVKAQGADVRILYSPMEALKIAKENPGREVVFLGVGFETTAPAIAMTIDLAKREKIGNISVLISHFLVPPAMEAVMSSPRCVVQGFLAAGHVCTIMGYDEYLPICKQYQVPIVVTGFEPLDIVEGLYLCVKQLEEGRVEVENQYARSVKKEGNTQALRMMRSVFEIVDRKWRGIGVISHSGLGLKEEYREFDAESRFQVEHVTTKESAECISAEIMQGFKKPCDCPMFGRQCTPERPLGAPMVSTEGACSAYYLYEGARS